MSHLDLENVKFATRSIHAGQSPDPVYGALAMPIYLTSTFCAETTDAYDARKAAGGFGYSRSGNPTTRVLEQKIAALENAEDCVATASGMGAVGSIMVAFLHAGDHVVCGDTVYGGTSAVMRTNLPQFGVGVTFVDTSDLAQVEAAITEKTRIIYFETPANPTMKITDIAAVAEIAHKHPGIRVVVDNTFAPPPIQRPLTLGADLVLHSVTKYINGHGDVLGGAVAGSKADVKEIRMTAVTKMNGTPPSPFNSYLVLRGMKTLDLRVRRHCQNALEVARYLEKHPCVDKVYYPGLESFEGHAIAVRQMREGLYTGMVSFDLKEGIHGLTALEAGKKLLNTLKIPSIAVSLGDPDSLVEQPAAMTHAGVPREARLASGIADGMIRYSVGLEDIEDIVQDLEVALKGL